MCRRASNRDTPSSMKISKCFFSTKRQTVRIEGGAAKGPGGMKL